MSAEHPGGTDRREQTQDDPPSPADTHMTRIRQALELPANAGPEELIAQVLRLMRIRRQRDELLRAALAASSPLASAGEIQVLREVAQRLDLSLD